MNYIKDMLTYIFKDIALLGRNYCNPSDQSGLFSVKF